MKSTCPECNATVRTILAILPTQKPTSRTSGSKSTIFLVREEIKRQGWPIVRFENGVERTIYPHCSVTELGSGPPFSVISRTQIPLVAGWAITVHKSQGMTIARAVVDMDRACEYGQSYVAMSRAKSLEGLVVRGLASGKATGVDCTVKSFMARTFPCSYS